MLFDPQSLIKSVSARGETRRVGCMCFRRVPVWSAIGVLAFASSMFGGASVSFAAPDNTTGGEYGGSTYSTSMPPQNNVFGGQGMGYILGSGPTGYNGGANVAASQFFTSGELSSTCGDLTNCRPPRVPEPSSVILLGTSAAGVLFATYRRRSRMKQGVKQ
jgi:hypothetical protein